MMPERAVSGRRPELDRTTARKDESGGGKELDFLFTCAGRGWLNAWRLRFYGEDM